MSALRSFSRGAVLIASLTVAGWSVPLAEMIDGEPAQSPVREFTVTARRYEFSPNRIEVKQGDLVKITLIAEDIPHSFTIDEYRIAKRASPGKPATFEFCASQAGRFVFYCNLTAEEGCRAMRGELVVK